MKNRFIVFALVLSGLLLAACNQKHLPSTGQRVPESIKNAIRNAPEDALLGVGSAKTESDGESILLAECHAREEIARQIKTLIRDTTKEYPDTTGQTEELVEAIATASVRGSRVVVREKTSDGAWWCVVELQKNNNPVTLRQNDVFDIVRSNVTEGGNAVSSNVNTAIPDWVLRPQTPKDVLEGVGAAKLDNDNDSIILAKERARRSLSYSIETEINDLVLDFTVDDVFVYQDVFSSNVSKYNYTAIETLLVRQEKTKDGTWWVMLHCPIQFP